MAIKALYMNAHNRDIRNSPKQPKCPSIIVRLNKLCAVLCVALPKSPPSGQRYSFPQLWGVFTADTSEYLAKNCLPPYSPFQRAAHI